MQCVLLAAFNYTTQRRPCCFVAAALRQQPAAATLHQAPLLLPFPPLQQMLLSLTMCNRIWGLCAYHMTNETLHVIAADPT
jgi:hypothetical protein